MTHLEYLQFSPYFTQADVENPDQREQFLASYAEAPQSIKDFLVAEETSEQIQSLAQRFNLDEEETEGVALTVRKIALAEINLQNAESLLLAETNQEGDMLRQILRAILTEVLASVIEDVKNLYRARPIQQPATNPNQPKKISPAGIESVTSDNVIDLRNIGN